MVNRWLGNDRLAGALKDFVYQPFNPSSLELRVIFYTHKRYGQASARDVDCVPAPGLRMKE